MEQHSQNSSLTDSMRILEGQLRECYGRVVYSHKTHEKCSDLLLSRLSSIKVWQIILSAITTSGFIATVLGAGDAGAIIGTIVSTILLALNAYTKNNNHGELAQKHKQAAIDLWIIREKYLSLLTDIRLGEKSIPTLQNERDALLKQLHSIYKIAPSTNYKAYKKAQDALQKYEDMTFSDKEIDAFLPNELRRSV